MKLLKEFMGTKQIRTKLDENYNITTSSGGGGYLESFMDNQKEGAALKEIIKLINDYVKVSAQWAEEEGVTPEEQHKAIVEDILSYILVKVK